MAMAMAMAKEGERGSCVSGHGPSRLFSSSFMFPAMLAQFQSVAGDVITVAGWRERARKAERVYETPLRSFII
jgi:hypothetical protein